MARKPKKMAKTAKDDLKLRPAEELYFALEDYDLTWTKKEIAQIIGLWKQSYDIKQISHELGRPVIEIAVLIMSLAQQNRLTGRKLGVYGGEVESREKFYARARAVINPGKAAGQ